MIKMKIKKGDNVRVMAGKDNGKTGKITQVFPKEGKVVVEGVNKTIKHAKTRRQGDKGQKIEFFGPVNASNVAVICPKCGKPARVGFQILDGGKRSRVCKKCNASLE